MMQNDQPRRRVSISNGPKETLEAQSKAIKILKEYDDFDKPLLDFADEYSQIKELLDGGLRYLLEDRLKNGPNGMYPPKDKGRQSRSSEVKGQNILNGYRKSSLPKKHSQSNNTSTGKMSRG
jgi:hypothetical protein